MQTLDELFFNAFDEVTNLPWHIYDTNNHNKLITNNYGDLLCSEMKELDDASVISCQVRETKKGRYVAVYIKLKEEHL